MQPKDLSARWSLVLALLVFGIIPESHSSSLEDDVRPGYVYVKVKSSSVYKADHTGDLLDVFRTRSLHIRSVEKAFPFLERRTSSISENIDIAELKQIYLVSYDAPYTSQFVADMLGEDNRVEYAEPVPIYRTFGVEKSAIPDDEFYAYQSHLAKMALPDAWELVKGQDGDVIIAVVDDGHTWSHPDLQGNLWSNPDEIPDNGIDDDGNGFVDDVRGWNFSTDSNDPDHAGEHAHGTAVAGVVNAVSDNGIGIAGSAWNARYMPISTQCKDRREICFAIDGVLYAALEGAHIINASWGSNRYSRTGQTIFKKVEEMGSLVVTSASNRAINSDDEPSYPAGYRTTLSVGGIDADSDQSRFAYGRSVNVFAPGINVHGTTKDGYAMFDGTSLATPLVSGVAALVRTRFPSYTPAQIREQVRLTALSIDDVQAPSNQGLYGRGKVNALRAVSSHPLPGIRLDTLIYRDQTESELLDQGDQVKITATFTNYHGEASNVRIELVTDAGHGHSVSAPVVIGNFASGRTVTRTFSFVLGEIPLAQEWLSFYFRITDGDFTDTPDVARIPVNRNNSAIHRTSALQVSITNEGNLGYDEIPIINEVLLQGIGFQIKDNTGALRNPLFEGGIILATDENHVSDCIRGTRNRPAQDTDLIPNDGEMLAITAPGSHTTEESRITMSDQEAPNPIGLEILQESYVNDTAEHEDFIILKYTVTNVTERVIQSLYMGLFIDWDVAHDADDTYHYDLEREAGYITDPGNTLMVGMRQLARDGPLLYHTIENEADGVYGGFSSLEKWNLLRASVSPDPSGTSPRDLSQLIGSGPHFLSPGKSIEVAIAVIGGDSREDFYRNSDHAKMLWKDVISLIQTSAERPHPTNAWSLSPPYPNPSFGSINLSFTVDEPGSVEIAAYDILGRRVDQLSAGSYGSGLHRLIWNPEHLPAGVYIVKLFARGVAVASQTAVISR